MLRLLESSVSTELWLLVKSIPKCTIHLRLCSSKTTKLVLLLLLLLLLLHAIDAKLIWLSAESHVLLWHAWHLSIHLSNHWNERLLSCWCTITVAKSIECRVLRLSNWLLCTSSHLNVVQSRVFIVSRMRVGLIHLVQVLNINGLLSRCSTTSLHIYHSLIFISILLKIRKTIILCLLSNIIICKYII